MFVVLVAVYDGGFTMVFAVVVIVILESPLRDGIAQNYANGFREIFTSAETTPALAQSTSFSYHVTV